MQFFSLLCTGKKKTTRVSLKVRGSHFQTSLRPFFVLSVSSVIIVVLETIIASSPSLCQLLSFQHCNRALHSVSVLFLFDVLAPSFALAGCCIMLYK